MNFYLFKLERIDVITPRSHLDDDVVTFQVRLNGSPAGQAAGLFVSMKGGAKVPPFLVPAKHRINANRNWDIGPFEIGPTDVIEVMFSGTNVSDDNSITAQTEAQDKLELQILGKIFSAIGGVFTGSAILGLIGGILT